MRACPICATSEGLEYLWGTRTIRCPKCGLAYTDNVPTLAELEATYSKEYFHGHTAYRRYELDKVGIQRHFRHRIELIRRYQSDGTLFEAGCAYGFFLDLAQGYWAVRGIDISAAASEYARDVLKLPVSEGDFESHPPEPNHYDVVTMWDTIEHLYDPVVAIRKSAEALKPGGILALTTGDLDAWLPRLQRAQWRMIIPAHLYYFSRRSITYLLNQYSLEIVHFSHVGYYRSLRQMAQIFTWRKPDSAWRHSLQARIETLPFMDLHIPLNLYDIMFVIARKARSI